MAFCKVLVILSTVIVGCSSLNIVQTAQGAADFSILVEAITKADLGTALAAAGPFTVFAPTNAAFNAALTALNIDKATLLARPDLADIVKYHVLSGKTMAADLTATQSPATLSGVKVTITKANSAVKFADATVTSADLACDNGVIHTIDKVVLPPNIVQTAQAATPEFSILVEALTKANLVTTLSGTGPFTVFAPTNAAFTAALTTLNIDKAALLDRADLADILKYHVVSGKIMAADLKASQFPATVNTKGVMITKAGSDVKFATAAVTGADLLCGNGVIHTIDKVVLPPPKNIVQTALLAAPEYSVLVEALVKANLVTTLSGTGPFTVFAPTNAAFTAALAALKIDKAALLARADLADILKYHVLSAKIMAADLKATQSPKTVQGQTVVVTKVGSAVKFGDAKVTGADTACTNGVIHKIDKVVLPPSSTVSVSSGAEAKLGSFALAMAVAVLLNIA